MNVLRPPRRRLDWSYRPGMLKGYTRGSDGLYRKLVRFETSGQTIILVRNCIGQLMGSETVTAQGCKTTGRVGVL